MSGALRRTVSAGSRAGLPGFARLCAASMFLVVVMGALVTDSGSSRGCGGSWPLCDGHLLPALSLRSLIEYGHRAVAGIVGLMVWTLAVWAWRSTHGRRLEVRVLALIAAVFVLVQASLGAAAVIWPEAPAILALHFGLSLTAFAAVLLLAAVLHPNAAWRSPVPRGLAVWTWITVAYFYGVVYLGALVTHADAGMACLHWPLCGANAGGNAHWTVVLVVAHRHAALGLLILIAWLQWRIRRLPGASRGLRVGSGLALALGGAQIGSGAALVWTRLSVPAVLVHSTLVCALFGAVAYLALAVLPSAPVGDAIVRGAPVPRVRAGAAPKPRTG